MSYSLDSITSGRNLRPPRVILIGREKVGKSYLASGADGVVMMPIKGEEGIDGIDCPKLPTSNTFQDVLNWLGSLAKSDHNYKTVVIDSASTLEGLIWDETVARALPVKGKVPKNIEEVGGGYSKGFTEALTYWRKITNCLDYLREHKNMASIVIGHVTVKTATDPESEIFDQYVFDIHKKAAGLLNRWADCILFETFKTIVEKEDVGFNKTHGRGITTNMRELRTTMNAANPAGGRWPYGELPPVLQLPQPPANGWKVFTKAVAKVIKESKPPAKKKETEKATAEASA